jgi:hypothetical protein
MTARETRRYEMLARVQQFGAARRERFPESSVGGRAFGDVAAAVAQLRAYAAARMATNRERTQVKTLAREALVRRLATISSTARVMAATTPGIDDLFRLSRHRRLTDLTLLTTGRMFVHEAGAFKGRFLAYHLSPAAVEELPGLVEEFEQAIRRHDSKRCDQAATRAGMTAAFQSGLAAARLLDVLVDNLFQGDAIAMALWRRARRIGNRSRSKAAVAASGTDNVVPLKVISSH